MGSFLSVVSKRRTVWSTSSLTDRPQNAAIIALATAAYNPAVGRDYYHREREHDHYRRQREADHYHDRRERDHYRRKRERERDAGAIASEAVLYSPLAAALRVAVLVSALWLVLTVLSLDEAIVYDWWQTAFIVGGLIALIGLGRELVLAVIRAFSSKRSGFGPIAFGGVAGIVLAGALHVGGVMGTIAEVLANAPPV